MGFCELIEDPERPGFQHCRHCLRPRFWPDVQKRPRPMPERYRRACPGHPVDAATKPTADAGSAPGIVQRVRSYSAARKRQMEAGDPTRSDEETALIYARCQECPSGKFKADPLLPVVMGGGQCLACGCGLSAVRKIFNAARWATWKCRLGHWDDLPITYVGEGSPQES